MEVREKTAFFQRFMHSHDRKLGLDIEVQAFFS